LYGRDAELQQLSHLVDRAAAGEPFVAIVEGEAGIGKSRLLDDAIALGEDLRVDVIRAKAYELEQDRPFGLFVDALGLHPDATDPECAALGRVLRARPDQPVEAPQSPAGYEVADRILDLVERRGGGRPVLLAVDDIQWADSATLRTIARLARSRSHTSTSLLLAARPTPRSEELDALLRIVAAEGGVRIGLAPLAPDAIAAIASEVLEATPGPQLLQRLAGAAGNPLYVVEVLAALDEENAVHVTAATADVSGNDLPPSLRLTILKRLGFLPDPTIKLLRTAAVLGASFPISDLAIATGERASELSERLGPALDANVVVADGEVLRFRHDLIHEAIYTDIPEAIRLPLHVDIGRALAAANADAGRIARHLELGTIGLNAEVSDALWLAAETVVLIDPAGASALWDRCLQRTPLNHPDLTARGLHVAKIGLRLGLAGAEQRARTMLTDSTPEDVRWAIDVGLTHHLGARGYLKECEERAFAEPRPYIPQAIIASALAGALLRTGDLAAAESAMSAVLANTVVGHPAEAAFNEFHTGDKRAGSATPKPSPARLLQAGLSADKGAELGQAIADNNVDGIRALVAWLQGRFAVAAAVFGPSYEKSFVALRDDALLDTADGMAIMFFADVNDDRWKETVAYAARYPLHGRPEIDDATGYACWLTGDWDGASISLETAAALAAETGIAWMSHLTCGVAASIAFHRGDQATATKWLDAADAIAPGFGLTRLTRALTIEAEGRPDEAFALLSRTWDKNTARGFGSYQRLYAADLVRLAIAVGEHDKAAAAVTRVEELADMGGTAPAQAIALRCRGLLEEDPALLLDAAALFQSAERPVEAAYAQEDAAILLAARGDTAQARQLADAAVAAYEKVQATRDIGRATRRLRDQGIQRRTSRTKARPAAGWDSLTGAETRVVELVAAGHTYREVGERLFISRRTVETHVAHVFTKLDLKSKTELATAYARHTND
jgi:DNA-binding CsgD family transcriptional regulator